MESFDSVSSWQDIRKKKREEARAKAVRLCCVTYYVKNGIFRDMLYSIAGQFVIFMKVIW